MRSQQENLEHEFLLAFVTHAQEQYVLRLERSTPLRQRRSFCQKLTQTSSSILPALDMVRISSSSAQLTSGMDRGAFSRVATLPFSSQKSFALRELCLILSFFPAFSPQYKLRAEQCYWFCDVVLSTVLVASGDTSIVKEEGYKKAGKFGNFSVQLSTTTRKLFTDAYSVVRTLERGSQLGTLPGVTLARENVDTLVSLLAVPSSEARTSAVIALTHLASQSPRLHQMVAEAGTATKLLSIIPSASPRLKVHIITALDAVADEWFWCGLKSADIDVLTHFLSLSLFSNDEVTCKKAASMLCMMASAEGGNRAFVALSSSLSLQLPPHSQLAALEAIISYLNRHPQLITDNMLLPFFNILSPVAPTQTRTRAILALTCLVRKSLECRQMMRMTSPAPEAGKFSEKVLWKLRSLFKDDNATIRAAASQRLTDLANHSEFPPIFQFDIANELFKPNCTL
jgi:hypothetical protein